ncbi:MAG: STAS domain-containing protein [Planctomycetaceae bacterium]|nr:MAG: STAS domain-containing protein [Planctomycetaceae bacterium]
MIQFTCSSCLAKFKVSDDTAGKKGKCPKCGSAIEIPATGSSDADDVLLAPATSDDSGEIPLADETPKKAVTHAARQSPMPAAKGLVITTFQDIAVVDLQHSSILDGLVIDGIGKELYVLVDQQARRKIIMDFAKVKFMSSQMLGVIITLHKKSAAIKGQVILCGLNKDLMNVFTIMKLDKIVRIVKDESEAMAVLGFKGGA